MFRMQGRGGQKEESSAKPKVPRSILKIEPLEERNLLAFLAPMSYPVGSSPKNIAVLVMLNDGVWQKTPWVALDDRPKPIHLQAHDNAPADAPARDRFSISEVGAFLDAEFLSI